MFPFHLPHSKERNRETLERSRGIEEQRSYPHPRDQMTAVNWAPLAGRGTNTFRFLSESWERPPEARASILRGNLEASPQPAASVPFPEHPEPAPSHPPMMPQSPLDRTPSAARVAKTEPNQEYSKAIRTTAHVAPEAFPP